MDLQARKIEFIQEFLKIQQEDIIIRLEKILKKEKLKLDSEQSNPFSLDEFNDRIEKSMNDSHNGRLTENKDLLAEVKKWH
ncbi:MAG: hypothetical protein H8E98_01105 [Bacteroidetes bacterium]|nr:hypothetical protein [Bacteroidota bacterium]